MVLKAQNGLSYTTTKQGDSGCEVIIYFDTKFKLHVSVDLTVIENDTFLDLLYVTVIHDM